MAYAQDLIAGGNPTEVKRLRLFRTALQTKNQQLPPSVSPESAGNSQGCLSKVYTHAKLPKLELRKFHGNPIEWYPFWDSFESAVHKNPNLCRVDKFSKSLLTGTAQSVVADLCNIMIS